MDAIRKDLNHWIKQRKQAEKQIEALTRDPLTHKKYAKTFQAELEARIRAKYPRLDRVKQYQIYQSVRHKLYEYFGYETPMMTSTEFKQAIDFIDNLTY